MFFILAVLPLLCISCERDNTAELRENFQTLDTYGICRDGEMILSIDMSKYQYMYSPSKGICRFTDESGVSDLTLTLTGGDFSEDSSVQCSVSGTLGQNGAKISGLYLLKKTTTMVWLWSNSDKCGLILPAWGTVNR